MEVDWADGDYGRTAAELAPAADALVEHAQVRPGMHVLDVGCGTGNATLAAAAAGARVTGVDPAEGLLEIARDRVAVTHADVTFLEGSAERLPVADAVADVALSVFGVIFATDPAAAIAEMRRATRAGGTIALTTWRPTGAVAAAGDVLLEYAPPDNGPVRKWGDDAWVRSLLADAGLDEIEIVDDSLSFRAASPAAFLDDLENEHPAWRAIHAAASDADRAALHSKSLAALEAGNEDPGAFVASSTYALIRARVPETAAG